MRNDVSSSHAARTASIKGPDSLPVNALIFVLCRASATQSSCRSIKTSLPPIRFATRTSKKMPQKRTRRGHHVVYVNLRSSLAQRRCLINLEAFKAVFLWGSSSGQIKTRWFEGLAFPNKPARETGNRERYPQCFRFDA